jgi:Cu(I)/Ag(I) efflux system membrane fusion protein
VRVELENPKGVLYPGAFANVTIRLDPARGVVVPAEAVVDTGEHQYVFVVPEPGRFEPRKVEVGARFDAMVELRDGVAPEEIVVTTAGFLIDSESRLRAAIEKR